MLVETKILHFRGGYIGCLIRKTYLLFFFVFSQLLELFILIFLVVVFVFFVFFITPVQYLYFCSILQVVALTHIQKLFMSMTRFTYAISVLTNMDGNPIPAPGDSHT